MSKQTVDIKDKVLLTFSEAAQYYNIGENKLRNMASMERNPSWLLYNGSKALIKRVQLEQILLKTASI